jgi:endonuclease YncB( thermonuclease family)
MSEIHSIRPRTVRRACGAVALVTGAVAVFASGAHAARNHPLQAVGLNQGFAVTRSTDRGVVETADSIEVVVTGVVDGDTVVVSPGGQVRVIGIDTPERGRRCYSEATEALKKLVLNKRVQITTGKTENRDRHGRLLRYVDVDGFDAGRSMIELGFAVARYDSRDGYGLHPRETEYVALDLTTPAACAPTAGRSVVDLPGTTVATPPMTVPRPSTTVPKPAAAGCDPSYSTLCLLVGTPDLDCRDITARRFPVVSPDPHRFDRDRDGIGCER